MVLRLEQRMASEHPAERRMAESSAEKTRVLLMLPSLHGGGAERVAVNIAKWADPARFDVQVGLLRRDGSYLEELDPKIVHSPGKGEAYMNFDVDNRKAYQPARIALGGALTVYHTAKMIRDHAPDVVMSFRKGMSVAMMAALPLVGSARPAWIAREGNNTFAVIDDELSNPLARRAVTKLTEHCYRSADHLVTISHKMGATLQSRFKLSPDHVTTIHNAIEVERVRELARESPGFTAPGKYLVSVGRLSRQKAFDVLLKACEPLLKERDLHLVILGQGEEEHALRKLTAGLGLEHNVHFPGFFDNPWAIMRRAEAFVFPSRWEGFGNVVGEAIALGLPAIVSDCDFGPSEIVRHDREGLVVAVDDVLGFRAAIARVLDDASLRTRFLRAALERSEAFRAATIVEQYCQLFERMRFK